MKREFTMEYHCLRYLRHYPTEIPEYAGIYYWVYWPNFTKSDFEHSDFIEKLKKFSNADLTFSTYFQNFKFSIEVSESRFSDRSDRLFGLSPKREEALIEYLKNPLNSEHFISILSEACFSRPFYVGKADNLRRRLRDHFESRSEVLPQIHMKKLHFDEIWIGYRQVEDEENPEINTIVEEVIQRIVKPGLTKRAG